MNVMRYPVKWLGWARWTENVRPGVCGRICQISGILTNPLREHNIRRPRGEYTNGPSHHGVHTSCT